MSLSSERLAKADAGGFNLEFVPIFAKFDSRYQKTEPLNRWQVEFYPPTS